MGIFDKIKSGFMSNREVSAVANSSYDGADRMNAEMVRWNPSLSSADGDTLPSKEILDARGRDMVRNDPLISSAVDLYRNGVVGSKMVLNAKPNGKALGFSDDSIDEIQEEIESLFDIYAYSDRCYIDASQRMNLTDIIRLAVGGSVFTGEFLGTFEYFNDRPFRTAIQVIDPDRLSNPNNNYDTYKIRGGVEKDRYGSPIAYHIKTSHPGDFFIDDINDHSSWKRIEAKTSWGRRMVLHIFEGMRPDQTRGVAKMVSALRQMKMTSKFGDVALQNAVIQALVVATIESDLNPVEAYRLLGAEDSPHTSSNFLTDVNDAYLNEAINYMKTGQTAKINGAMIPYMPVGTKLNAKSLGDGTLGTNFETSLIRKIAAGLGVSHEELSKNLSETSFAGVKAAMAQTSAQMLSVKRAIADKIASGIYRNWLEEVIGRGMISSMPSYTKGTDWIMKGFNLDAMSSCSWIGAARTTIDEYNETRAAEKRYSLGFTTMEYECSRIGLDWRDVKKQRQREENYLKNVSDDSSSVSDEQKDTNNAFSDSVSVDDRISTLEDFIDNIQNNE